jgi:hypothetical protein
MVNHIMAADIGRTLMRTRRVMPRMRHIRAKEATGADAGGDAAGDEVVAAAQAAVARRRKTFASSTRVSSRIPA